MSPQKDQDYFCEGMAEAIMNALTKLANPRVVARTSAFQFKGQALCEVGKKFDVTAVLEGSVRRAITGDSEADHLVISGLPVRWQRSARDHGP